MLVLSRKPGEKIQIGADIRITVLETKGDRVKIGIEAPDDVRIMREELLATLMADLGRDSRRAERVLVAAH